MKKIIKRKVREISTKGGLLKSDEKYLAQICNEILFENPGYRYGSCSVDGSELSLVIWPK